MSPPLGPPRILSELAGEYRHFALIEAPAHGSHLYAACPIWLVGMEAPDVLASLGLGLSEAGPGGFSGLALSRFDADGTTSCRLLAHCHAHARWLGWLDPATTASA